MSDALLRSALWYLSKWNMNPVFCNVFKKPLHDWSNLYGSEISREGVIKIYRSVVGSGGKPAAVALLPSASSRTVVLDLDIYRVDFGMSGAEVATLLVDHGFVASVTPRGGVRVVFAVQGEIPGRISVSWHGRAIGEGGGRGKHMWHFPPSVACLESGDGGRCRSVGKYYFVVSKKRLVRYPWELVTEKLPEWSWSEAVDLLKAILQVEISEESIQATYGDLKPGTASKVRVTIPCWRDLNEFVEWLNGLSGPQVALPACVARALGYRVTADLRNEYTGEKVPHGLRFTLGAVGVMFLAATVARASVKELVDFVGQNLEDYPSDEGEPLNTRLSRLLVVAGNMVLPRYSGLGGIGSIPPELCSSCQYSDACRNNANGGKVPWQAFTHVYWEMFTKESI
ncbi:MAG: hypothetical protein QW584_00395 [Thermofilaceae archaeon]